MGVLRQENSGAPPPHGNASTKELIRPAEGERGIVRPCALRTAAYRGEASVRREVRVRIAYLVQVVQNIESHLVRAPRDPANPGAVRKCKGGAELETADILASLEIRRDATTDRGDGHEAAEAFLSRQIERDREIGEIERPRLRAHDSLVLRLRRIEDGSLGEDAGGPD